MNFKQLFLKSLLFLPVCWFIFLIVPYFFSHSHQYSWIAQALLDLNKWVFLLLLAQVYLVCFINLHNFRSISKLLLGFSLFSLFYFAFYSITRYMSHIGFDPKPEKTVGVGFATIISGLTGLAIPVVILFLYLVTYFAYQKEPSLEEKKNPSIL